MQTLEKPNPPGEPAARACRASLNRDEHALPLANPRWLPPLVLIAGLATAAGNVHAASDPAENTGRNAHDNSGTLTPQDQKENSGDIKITAAIRKAVVKNKSLSLDAHNAKIITQDGVVTLRGPVETANEKAKLQAIAEKTHGVKQVDNQLEAKTP